VLLDLADTLARDAVGGADGLERFALDGGAHAETADDDVARAVGDRLEKLLDYLLGLK
jgi:hypothetical protein